MTTEIKIYCFLFVCCISRSNTNLPTISHAWLKFFWCTWKKLQFCCSSDDLTFCSRSILRDSCCCFLYSGIDGNLWMFTTIAIVTVVLLKFFQHILCLDSHIRAAVNLKKTTMPILHVTNSWWEKNKFRSLTLKCLIKQVCETTAIDRYNISIKKALWNMMKTCLGTGHQRNFIISLSSKTKVTWKNSTTLQLFQND